MKRIVLLASLALAVALATSARAQSRTVDDYLAETKVARSADSRLRYRYESVVASPDLLACYFLNSIAAYSLR